MVGATESTGFVCNLPPTLKTKSIPGSLDSGGEGGSVPRRQQRGKRAHQLMSLLVGFKGEPPERLGGGGEKQNLAIDILIFRSSKHLLCLSPRTAGLEGTTTPPPVLTTPKAKLSQHVSGSIKRSGKQRRTIGKPLSKMICHIHWERYPWSIESLGILITPPPMCRCRG